MRRHPRDKKPHVPEYLTRREDLSVDEVVQDLRGKKPDDAKFADILAPPKETIELYERLMKRRPCPDNYSWSTTEEESGTTDGGAESPRRKNKGVSREAMI